MPYLMPSSIVNKNQRNIKFKHWIGRINVEPIFYCVTQGFATLKIDEGTFAAGISKMPAINTVRRQENAAINKHNIEVVGLVIECTC